MEGCVEAGFLLDDVVEHVEVDSPYRADELPLVELEALGLGELVFFCGSIPKLEGVGVARLENDLHHLDFLGALDVELKAVAEVYELFST